MRNRILHWQIKLHHTLYFWPLLIMAGRMVQRIVLNVWNLVEPGGP